MPAMCGIGFRAFVRVMMTKEELREDTGKMLSLWMSAQLAFDDYKYLRNPDTEIERAVVEHDPYIQRSTYIQGVFCVLQLSKIFGGKNDDFSLRKLLNKLLNEHRGSPWSDKLALTTIKEWIAELEADPIAQSAKRLSDMRDKHFAHSDRNAPPIEDLITSFWTDAPILLAFADRVVGHISLEVCEQYYYTYGPSTAQASDILKRLTIHLQHRHLSPVSREDILGVVNTLPASFPVEEAIHRVARYRDELEQQFHSSTPSGQQ